MFIKEDSIRRLQGYLNIVDIISEYVLLKKRGRNYTGLCPFHKEKTPSFSVSEEKGMFYCFGCGEGGNAISFLMKMEKYSFVEAIEQIAKKINFQLEYEEGKEFKEKENDFEKLYEYSNLIAKYYYDCLTKTNEGSNAYQYLIDRGLKENTIVSFGLGLALSAWNHLSSFIQKNNLDINIFEQLGLLIKSEDGNYYERFRERIMFPIFSPAGRVIAFGGRILNNLPDQAKYLNSPETKIFIKGKTLYGLSQSKDHIRKKDSAIIVEGYMDLISLFQNGFNNVVASCGTALTEDQIQILSRYSKNIFVMYDSDAAGKKASARAIELLLETDLNFKIVNLKEGEDPDSYVKKYGFDVLNNEIKNSQSYIDFLYDFLYSNLSEKDGNLKFKALDKTIELTAKVKDPVRRALFVKDISDKYKILESSILQKIDSYLKREKYSVQNRVDEKEKLENKDSEKSKLPFLEIGILKLLLDEKSDIIDFIYLHISEKDFEDPKLRQIAKLIFDDISKGVIPKAQDIINRLDDLELQNIISEITFAKYKISENWQQTSNYIENSEVDWNEAEDYIKKIKIREYERELEKNSKKIKSSTDLETINKLLEYDNAVREEIKKILNKNYKEWE